MKQSNGRTKTTLKCLLLAGAMTLTACTSPQVRFHTLMPAPGQQPAQQPTRQPIQQTEAAGQADISVTSVSVPAQVERSELVLRKGISELVVLSSDWWSASLSEEIRSALVAGFGPGATEAPRVGLRLQITRFDSVPGRHAWLEARYRVTAQDGEGDRRLSCSARLRTAVSDAGDSPVDGLVLAQQENLRLLIEHIMMAASGLAVERGCP